MIKKKSLVLHDFFFLLFFFCFLSSTLLSLSELIKNGFSSFHVEVLCASVPHTHTHTQAHNFSASDELPASMSSVGWRVKWDLISKLGGKKLALIFHPLPPTFLCKGCHWLLFSKQLYFMHFHQVLLSAVASKLAEIIAHYSSGLCPYWISTSCSWD